MCPTAPTTITQGSLVGTCNTSLGSVCTYECDEGFKFSGDSTITCQSNRTWSVPPVCTRVSCSSAPTLDNGHIVGVCDDVYQSVCHYSCDSTDYSLSGPSSISCLSNGQWSSLGTCSAVSCSVFIAPVNYNGICFNMSIGASCQLECTYGGIAPVVVCQADGTWTVPFGCEARVDDAKDGDTDTWADSVPEAMKETTNIAAGVGIMFILVAVVCLSKKGNKRTTNIMTKHVSDELDADSTGFSDIIIEMENIGTTQPIVSECLTVDGSGTACDITSSNTTNEDVNATVASDVI